MVLHMFWLFLWLLFECFIWHLTVFRRNVNCSLSLQENKRTYVTILVWIHASLSCFISLACSYGNTCMMLGLMGIDDDVFYLFHQVWPGREDVSFSLLAQFCCDAVLVYRGYFIQRWHLHVHVKFLYVNPKAHKRVQS